MSVENIVETRIKSVQDVDLAVLADISNTLEQRLKEGKVHSEKDVYSVLSAELSKHGIGKDETEKHGICSNIYKDLISSGIIKKNQSKKDKNRNIVAHHPWWDPFNIFDEDDSFHAVLSRPHKNDYLSRRGGTSFATDVIELSDGTGYVVRADLPGLSKEDITTEITNDSLIIEAHRKNEYEHHDTGHGVYKLERSYGHIYRKIPLPKDIDHDNIKARYDNGVLDINLPKIDLKKAQQRRINID